MRLCALLILSSAICIGLAGCAAQPAAQAAIDVENRPNATIPSGTHCVVQLQRNALGGGSSTPISATATNYNGAALSYTGTMKQMDSDWIVLTLDDKSECWIAKSAVLTITIPATR